MQPDCEAEPRSCKLAALRVADDCAEVLREARPLIDVRAPSEYARGALPGAVNLPLLDDEERVAVGTTYKRRGRAAAIELGHRLVCGDSKRARVEAWRTFVEAHPNAAIYCARGGLRSEIAQTWLAEAGVHQPRVAGGFKALRRHCLDVLERMGDRRFVLVGGRTGSGKTSVVRGAAVHIDLERLANHRGSAFGALPTPQPPPVAFENALAVEFMRLPLDATIVLEDESRTIGRLAIPERLYQAMQRAPIALIEADDDTRAENIYREYVLAGRRRSKEPERHTARETQPDCNAEPRSRKLEAEQPRSHLAASLERIQRRLGGVRYAEIKALMDQAFDSGAAAWPLHRRWIVRLLNDYYDPMYDYQLAAKADRVRVRGTASQVAAALRNWREGGDECEQS